MTFQTVPSQGSDGHSAIRFWFTTMGDLKHPAALWAKGILFVVLGVMAAGLILLRTRDATVTVLLTIAIWAFCRAYYFAFYVVQHYVDDQYRYAGLLDFLRYALTRRRRPDSNKGEADSSPTQAGSDSQQS